MSGIFGGLVLLLIIMLVMYAVSVAMTFWFISIPLIFFILYAVAKRGQTPISARAQADLDRFRAKEDMYRRIAKEQRSGR